MDGINVIIDSLRNCQYLLEAQSKNGWKNLLGGEPQELRIALEKIQAEVSNARDVLAKSSK